MAASMTGWRKKKKKPQASFSRGGRGKGEGKGDEVAVSGHSAMGRREKKKGKKKRGGRGRGAGDRRWGRPGKSGARDFAPERSKGERGGGSDSAVDRVVREGKGKKALHDCQLARKEKRKK